MFICDCDAYISMFYQPQNEHRASKVSKSDSSKFSFDKYGAYKEPGGIVANVLPRKSVRH